MLLSGPAALTSLGTDQLLQYTHDCLPLKCSDTINAAVVIAPGYPIQELFMTILFRTGPEQHRTLVTDKPMILM